MIRDLTHWMLVNEREKLALHLEPSRYWSEEDIAALEEIAVARAARGDLRDEQETLAILVDAYTDERDLERAMRAASRREQLCRELDDPGLLLDALLGHAIACPLDLNRSMRLQREHERRAAELGREADQALSMALRGMQLRAAGVYGEDEELFRRAREIASGLGGGELLEGVERFEAAAMRPPDDS